MNNSQPVPVHHWSHFFWTKTEFRARDTGWFQGFHWDKDEESLVFAIEGKTGLIEKFRLVADTVTERGERIFGVVPQSTDLGEFTGGTLVCRA